MDDGSSTHTTTTADEDSCDSGLDGEDWQDRLHVELGVPSQLMLHFGGWTPRHALVNAAFWPRVVAKLLVSILGAGQLLESSLLQARSLSTHCSGIGTVEHALLAIRSAFDGCLPGRPKLAVVSACDSSTACQRVLMQLGVPHVFTDLAERVHGTAQTLATLWDSCSWAQKQAYMAAAAVTRTASCCIHQAACCAPDADVDFSGTPCTMWSQAGCLDSKY
jgi:hypothetical protein